MTERATPALPKCEGRHCEGKSDGRAPHTCPYKEDIDDDHESLCNCCEDCAHECAMDI